MSRDSMLARIRAAIGPAVPGPAADHQADATYAALPRDYLRAHHDPASHDIVALFAERAADYRAVVERATPGEVPGAVARILARRAAAGEFVVADGLPGEWLAGVTAPVRLVRDVPPLPVDRLDGLDGVVTGCAAAIAETGTIVLDHGRGQGRRALSLVPDFHLVIVRADQVSADLADGLTGWPRPGRTP